MEVQCPLARGTSSVAVRSLAQAADVRYLCADVFPVVLDAIGAGANPGGSFRGRDRGVGLHDMDESDDGYCGNWRNIGDGIGDSI